MDCVVLEAKRMSYGVPGGRVLQRDLEFSLGNGEALLISGPNGAGKSTLLKLLLENESPLAGSFVCNVPRQKISFLPQLENTAVHLPFRLGDILRAALRGGNPEEAIERFPGLLTRAHLDLAWNASSGGERKRTLLLRTLLEEPSLLVLDEPLNHLDAASRSVVIRSVATYLVGATASKPRACVVVSHQGFAEESKGIVRLVSLLLTAATFEGGNT